MEIYVKKSQINKNLDTIVNEIIEIAKDKASKGIIDFTYPKQNEYGISIATIISRVGEVTNNSVYGGFGPDGIKFSIREIDDTKESEDDTKVDEKYSDLTLLEHAFINQFEDDYHSCDFGAISKLIEILLLNPKTKESIINYLSDDEKERLLEGKTYCRY